MTSKNPKPLTRPRKGEPNYGKSSFQPGSLPVSDLPMQPSLGMQQRTITKGSVVTKRINADMDDVITCPKIGKIIKIHNCVLTDCKHEKGHLIHTGKSYVHCSFCEGVQPSLKEQMQQNIVGFGDTVVDEAYRLAVMSINDDGVLDLEKLERNLTDLRSRSATQKVERQSETMDKPADSMDSPATMVKIHCPLCGWQQEVEEGMWKFQSSPVGHGYTCGSGKCPSHTYMVLGEAPATMANPPAVAFDHKACILCDRVIVQKILGNKCGESGALCCNLKSCPIEDRKKRESGPVCCQGSRRDSGSALWDC